MEPMIHLAFRFHGNFYHSYRGDTPDELGFGKDIRIIRHIINVLDEYNAKGIPVCGTWDFENYFSFEKIMPEHCPDIITAFQRRVKNGMDEVEFMSYNNGLMNAHTAREFEENIKKTISNSSGSGLRDLFGNDYETMVRPQEMTFSPIHIKLYKALGIDSISLYYSCVPFNSFSNFVPLLKPHEQYNPLTLTYPGIDESLILVPAYNVGDLADHLTLRRWVKRIRREQMKMPEPCDMLLVIDQDADDQFWYGFDVPAWIKNNFSTVRGLPGLLENIKDLDFIKFTTPGRYLKEHPPVKTVSFGQDTADGSFDGLSSWAEKWSNHLLYTGLERARILDLQTRRLTDPNQPGVFEKLAEALDTRIKILSTTHFGMAAPVMNLTRENTARRLVDQAVKTAAAAFTQIASEQPEKTFKLIDYMRGESTQLIQYQPHPSRGLVHLEILPGVETGNVLQRPDGSQIVCSIMKRPEGKSLYFVENFAPEEEKDFLILDENHRESTSSQLKASATCLQNNNMTLTIDQDGQVTGLSSQDQEYSFGHFLTSAVTYKGRTLTVDRWTDLQIQHSGPTAMLRMRGELILPGGYPVEFIRELLLADGLPYLYVNLHIRYPRTPDQGFKKGTAQRLQQKWDNYWQEVMPCQISPNLIEKPGSPLRVWKHNYCDHVTAYDLNYGSFSRNKTLRNANNQITHAWAAVSEGEKGLLVAQNANVLSSVAFCPLRTVKHENSIRVLLNPFGTYYGRQYHYATAETNLGNLMAINFSAADQLKSYAPSYNGRQQSISLMIAPYAADEPPDLIKYDAEAFAYPYILLSDGKTIATPPHRTWDGSGLGETPDGVGVNS